MNENPRHLLSALLGLALLFSATSLLAQEDGRTWRFSVKSGVLKPITLRDPVVPAKNRSYWYLTLEVSNDTGKSRRLALSARAETPDVKQKPLARPGLLPSVTKAIAKKEGLPKLENLLAASGRLPQGETRHFVVVFQDLSRLANHIDVRIAGFANTLYKAGKTVWREDTELSLRFHRIGDEFEVTRHEVRRRRPRWVTVKRSKIR